MSDLIESITDFIFAEDILEPADVVIAVGSANPEIPEKAADIYLNGYAKKIVVTGKYSYHSDCFPGVTFGAEYYTGNYQTEARFYTAVLVKSRVPLSDIIQESEARCPKEHALFTKYCLEKMGITFQKAIVVCPAYQSRRYQLLFQAAFPDAEIIMKPSILSSRQHPITRNDWYKSRYSIRFVLNELISCGEQLSPSELERICMDPDAQFADQESKML